MKTSKFFLVCYALCLFIFINNIKILPKNLRQLKKIYYVNFSKKSGDLNFLKGEKCVLHFLPSDWMGGVESCVMAHHCMLGESLQFKSLLFVLHNSPIQKNLTGYQIPHHASYAHTVISKNFALYEKILSDQVRRLCIQHNVDLIHCHKPYHLLLLKNAVKNLPVKIIFMHHGSRVLQSDLASFNGLDGVIAVNPTTRDILDSANKELDLKIRYIEQMFPPCHEKLFLTYRPEKKSRHQFFKSEYNISLSQKPLVCNIGNFYGPSQKPSDTFIFEKNQEVLIRATHKLVHERKKNFQMIFVGDGPAQVWHKQLVTTLNLEKHVHFLGFCNNIHKILYHTDIHVLPSYEESFGIATIEASFLKKPVIGSSKTGSEFTIVDGVTGFIFKNNDAQDLADKLELLLDNKDLRKSMGQNAYDYATGLNNFQRPYAHFLQSSLFELLTAFYKKILKK